MRSPYLGIRKNIVTRSPEITLPDVVFNLDALACRASKFVFPKTLTPALAEEIGIHLGDGHLSKNRNRYKLFGNVDESEYYTDFIVRLYKDLYGIDVHLVRRPDNTIGFEFSSREIWLFKTEILGIEAGRKDNIPVPKIVREAGTEIQKAFIRGYFDTDGTVYFQSRYGYSRYYPVVSAESKSQKLRDAVNAMLRALGFKTHLYQSPLGYFGICLYGYGNILKYATEIGWHNTKHLKKFEQWAEKYPYLANRAAAEIRTRSKGSLQLETATGLCTHTSCCMLPLHHSGHTTVTAISRVRSSWPILIARMRI